MFGKYYAISKTLTKQGTTKSNAKIAAVYILK